MPADVYEARVTELLLVVVMAQEEHLLAWTATVAVIVVRFVSGLPYGAIKRPGSSGQMLR